MPKKNGSVLKANIDQVYKNRWPFVLSAVACCFTWIVWEQMIIKKEHN